MRSSRWGEAADNGDPVKFKAAVDVVRSLDPDRIMPTRGAPQQSRAGELCDHRMTLLAQDRFRLPNDAGFRATLGQMKRA